MMLSNNQKFGAVFSPAGLIKLTTMAGDRELVGYPPLKFAPIPPGKDFTCNFQLSGKAAITKPCQQAFA